MPFIVFNKRTGGYLKRHSGSYRDLKWKSRCYGKIYNKVLKTLGPSPLKRDDEEAYNEHQQKVSQLIEKLIFNAEPGDARVYATKGSATSSVGVYNRGPDFKNRTYKMPDHLELHEIKEAFVCVMRPDGSSNCDEDDES